MHKSIRHTLDLKASIPRLRKELELINKYLFNCYLVAESTYVPLEKMRDMMCAFLVPSVVYQQFEKLAGNEIDLFSYAEIMDFINLFLNQVENEETSCNMNGWFYGLPYTARNKLQRKINTDYRRIIAALEKEKLLHIQRS